MELKNIKTFNFEGAIRGARNPLESYDKSDSCFQWDTDQADLSINYLNYEYIIGPKDKKLLCSLLEADRNKSSSPNSKFMRQILCSFDLTAPLFFWKEFDTYKIGTTSNSTSTMHTIQKKPITADCFEWGDYHNCRLEKPQENEGVNPWVPDMSIYAIWNDLVGILERLRQLYLETGDKEYWMELIRLLPEAWLQTRSITCNYQVLRNIYQWRHNHKLWQWRWFCEQIKERFPYAEELICYGID